MIRFLLVGGAVLAAPAIAAPEPACVIEPEESAPAAVWERSPSGDLLAALRVTGSGMSGADFWVRARLEFHGHAVEWEDGPYDAHPSDDVLVPVTLPQAAWFDPMQADYLSSLVVRVKLVRGHGEELHRSIWSSAEPIHVVFLEQAKPILMDRVQAGSEAPAGVYSATEQMRWAQLGFDLHQPGLILGPEVR